MMSALLPLPVYVQVRMFCHFPANPYKGFSVNFWNLISCTPTFGYETHRDCARRSSVKLLGRTSRKSCVDLSFGNAHAQGETKKDSLRLLRLQNI